MKSFNIYYHTIWATFCLQDFEHISWAPYSHFHSWLLNAWLFLGWMKTYSVFLRQNSSTTRVTHHSRISQHSFTETIMMASYIWNRILKWMWRFIGIVLYGLRWMLSSLLVQGEMQEISASGWFCRSCHNKQMTGNTDKSFNFLFKLNWKKKGA